MSWATQDRELRRNASGYQDETAYLAIKNTRGGVAVDGTDIKNGDIWRIDTAQGVREMLVVQVFNSYAVGLMLFDTARTENNIQVRSRSLMYADAGRIMFSYYDKFSEFVRALADNEMAEALDAVSRLLNLDRYAEGVVHEDAPAAPEVVPDAETVSVEEVKVRESEIRELKHALDDAMTKGDALRAELAAGDRALARAQQEKEIYERLYHEMLDRLLGK